MSDRTPQPTQSGRRLAVSEAQKRAKKPGLYTGNHHGPYWLGGLFCNREWTVRVAHHCAEIAPHFGACRCRCGSQGPINRDNLEVVRG